MFYIVFILFFRNFT